MTSGAPAVARVVLDSPVPQLDRLFDYGIPSELVSSVVPGVLVRVPLRSGARTVPAYVVDVEQGSTFDGSLSWISEVLSAAPVLPRRLYDLARLVADRQVGTVSDVLRTAIPRRYVRAEKTYLAGNRGDATPCDVAPIHTDVDWSVLLENGQRNAVGSRASSVALGEHATTTWSADMCCAATVAWASGKSIVLIVPDFRDVERLCSDLATIGLTEAVCRLDAEAPPAERWVNYLRCASGERVIVVGNRSAAYAPVAEDSIFMVWDDGDPIFAEPRAPYAHTREVLLIRQELFGGSLVFLHDSPSTDLVRLVNVGWVARYPRVLSRGARVTPLDNMAVESGTQIPSVAWQAARDALATGPVLVQVARPGFANLCSCATCREVGRCRDCGGPLRRRARGAVADCRWCGSLVTTFACPHCGGSELRDVAPGSDATAENIGKSFPGFPVVVSSGERHVFSIDPKPAIVVSTPGVEPFCPGGYAAVIILDAHRQLLTDRLRVVENALRLWSHASSLAAAHAPVFLSGSGSSLGQVMATSSQWARIEKELAERELMHLPPAARIATISGAPDALAQVLDALQAVPHFSELGPIPTSEHESQVIVPFAYRQGTDIAHVLRQIVLSRVTGPRSRQSTPALRVRMDELALSSP